MMIVNFDYIFKKLLWGSILLLNGCVNFSDNISSTNPHIGDTIINKFDKYDILSIHRKNRAGDEIYVYDKVDKTKWSIDVNPDDSLYKPLYFVNLINDKLILDFGTDIIRTLYVFDLNTKIIEFKSRYIDELKIDNNSISFTFIYIDENPPLIKDSIGFDSTNGSQLSNFIIENRVYELTNKKITKKNKPRFIQI